MAERSAKTATPRLRFPEFLGTGVWTVGNLATTARFVNDKIAVAKLGLDTYVSTENLAPDYGGITPASKLPDVASVTHFKRDDLLISNIRPYLKKVWRADRDGGASNDVIVVRRRSAISDAFLSLVLRNDAFIAYVMGSAKGVKMPRGDIDAMREYQVAYPEPAEQQKIAECLASLDEVIAAQGRKVEALKAHKRGLMQQLFPREGETRPRLRFPEFHDTREWSFSLLRELEDRKLVELGRGNVISHDDMRANPGSNPVYSSSVINHGLMGTYGAHMFDEELISWSVDGGGHFFHRPKHRFSVTNVSGFMRVLSDEIVCRFLAYQLQKLHAAHTFDYQQKAHPSVIRALYNVGLPDPREQQRIAECLTSLDTCIGAETDHFDALKTHKQGLMQQLFPAPEARGA